MSSAALVASSHIDTFARDHLPPPSQWPQFIFDRSEVTYPDYLNATHELLDANVIQGKGLNPALHGRSALGESFTWTYSNLLEKVDSIAHVLTKELGLVAGNRLLLRGGNSPMMAACFLAGIKAGLVMVPTMPLLRANELSKIIEKAEINVALCASNLAQELDHCSDPAHPKFNSELKKVIHFSSSDPHGLEALMQKHQNKFESHPTSKDDVCLIAFTSGTTGEPKGTMHFHRDILAMCDLFPRHILEMNSNDIVCGTPPIAFTFGLGGLLAFPLRYGASSVLIEKHTPTSLLETISTYRATQCYTAPTFYRQMADLADAFDLTSIRHPVSAGEALPNAIRELWRKKTGLEITDGIGGTELIHIYIASAGRQVRQGAIGQVVPGYRAQIVDENMQPVPPGTMGKLAVKGPTGCRYLSDPRQKDYVKNGWNLPGDTFVMDSDGYFSYVARNDDMIISSGYNIAGPEVESVLLLHPAVAECGVVGTPDEERGQIVTAFISLKAEFSAGSQLAEQLQEFVKQNIAPFKYPRRIEFLPELPRTETGKLQRFRLRELANNLK